MAGRQRVRMFMVSILESTKTGKSYIGSTNDLQRRLAEHNRGQTKSTRRKGKWHVVYKEEFKTNIEAKRRERMIKSYKGGNAFKQLVAGLVQW